MNRIRSLLILVFLLLLALAVVACGSDESAADEPAADMEEEMSMDEGDEMEDMATGGVPEGLDTSTEKMTDDGLFRVSISTALDPLILNEIHGWTVHVETADGEAVEGAEKLGGMKSVAAVGEEKGESALPENEPFDVQHVITLRRQGSAEVREMRA